MLRTLIAVTALVGIGAPAIAGDAHHRGAVAAQEFQQPAVFAYEAAHNYCPQGLQPVTGDGSVSCGRPDFPLTYRQVMRHPVQHARTAPHLASKEVPLKGRDVYVRARRGID